MENIVLEKINFVNGSAGKTPLNSNNMNAIQQNTENAINKVVPIITGIEENTENNNSDIAEAKINIENNTKNILEINNFIENSMKTLETEGTNIHVSDSADYPCKLEIEGKSEQVQTEQSANLCPNIDSDKWVLSGGAYKENGYIVLPQSGAKAEMDVEWNGQTANADGQYVIRTGAVFDTEDIVNAKYHINLEYLNANKEVLSGNGNADIIGGNDIWRKYGVVYSENDEHGAAIRDAKYITFTIQYSSQFNSAIFKFKNPLISKTSNDSYIPFVPNSPSPDYPSEIENVSGDLGIKVVGKNLLSNNVDDYDYTSGTYGFIKINDIKKDLIMPIKEKNTDIDLTGYAFGFTGNGINANEGYRWLISNGQITNNGKINNFFNETKMMYVSFYPNSRETLEKLFARFDVQVEEGTTATEIEPYKEQTVTFPLGTQKLMKDGYLGDDGIHNKRKQIVLDGTESYISEVLGSVYLYEIEKNDMLFSNGGKGLCSHFINYTNNYITKIGNIRFGWNNKNIYFYTSFPTLEEFKNWLAEQYSAGTPVVVEYEIEEEITEYTTEQQTAKKQIDALKTYRTVTNISNSQNTNMVLTYKKDLQTQFQELEAMLLESGV